MVTKYLKNGNLMKTIYTFCLLVMVITTIVGWKISADAYDRFVPKEEYRCDQAEISNQLVIIRTDIKLILRTLR